MAPTLQSGQRVWACLWPYALLRPGMLVLAEHPVYGLLAKRLQSVNAEHFELSSDNNAVESLGCGVPFERRAYLGRILTRAA